MHASLNEDLIQPKKLEMGISHRTGWPHWAFRLGHEITSRMGKQEVIRFLPVCPSPPKSRRIPQAGKLFNAAPRTRG
jgi:hypothetical protein